MDASQGNVPSVVLYGGMVLWLARELWGAVINRKRDKAENEANIVLVKGLSERIGTLERSIMVLEEKLTSEMKMRMESQEEAHIQRLRIQTLESTLRGLGATLPDVRT